MADFTSRGRKDEPGDENAGGEYVLVGSRLVVRDPKTRVLKVYKTGDKVTLDDEQAQRLRAGKVGSTFQREQDLPEPTEFEEVAVANEATVPAELDGFQVSPERTRNRRVPATRLPEASDAPATREQSEDERSEVVPEPVTTTRTASRPVTGKAAK